jgi:hypothetical protein
MMKVFVLKVFVTGYVLLCASRISAETMDPNGCGAQPGNGFCTCFWVTDPVGGKKIPNSHFCDKRIDIGGLCVTNEDCCDAGELNGIPPPSEFPYSNICPDVVGEELW